MSRWDNSDRASRLPSNWGSIRLAVLRRDGYKCTSCGARASQVDHVEPGDDHGMENLQSLCRFCHDVKTRREGAEAQRRHRAYLRSLTRRKPERSPGELPIQRATPSGRKGW